MDGPLEEGWETNRARVMMRCGIRIGAWATHFKQMILSKVAWFPLRTLRQSVPLSNFWPYFFPLPCIQFAQKAPLNGIEHANVLCITRCWTHIYFTDDYVGPVVSFSSRNMVEFVTSALLSLCLFLYKISAQAVDREECMRDKKPCVADK